VAAGAAGKGRRVGRFRGVGPGRSRRLEGLPKELIHPIGELLGQLFEGLDVAAFRKHPQLLRLAGGGVEGAGLAGMHQDVLLSLHEQQRPRGEGGDGVDWPRGP